MTAYLPLSTGFVDVPLAVHLKLVRLYGTVCAGNVHSRAITPQIRAIVTASADSKLLLCVIDCQNCISLRSSLTERRPKVRQRYYI